MLGKRGRPAFRRTSSMTSGFTIDAGSMEAAPPPPPAIGGELNAYDQVMFSPRFYRKNSLGEADVETAEFLRSCGLCNRRLAPGRDIYMYRGDTAFCSLECREQQIKQDERKERRGGSAATADVTNGESHRTELAAAVPETKTVAAA